MFSGLVSIQSLQQAQSSLLPLLLFVPSFSRFPFIEETQHTESSKPVTQSHQNLRSHSLSPSLGTSQKWRLMAKNNKYTAINFNHIYEKNITSISTTSKNPNPSFSPSSSHSYSAISNPNKSHGRILVLTRPTPKPKPVFAPPSQPQQQQPQNPVQSPRSEPGSAAISLRPLGSTGTGSSLSPPVSNRDKDKDPPPPATPKSNKFVPPHRRPGFVPRDAPHERLQGNVGSPGRIGQDGRPKSGGHERMMRNGGSDMGLMGRPRSSGNRPSSSG